MVSILFWASGEEMQRRKSSMIFIIICRQ